MGLKGKIVDETKNTIIVETKSGEKTVPKAEGELEVFFGAKKIALDPRPWCVAPENRIKAFFKNKKSFA